jgi:hypothetical protein
MVQIARGMKVMVTFNVETELDIANGVRGQIVDIVLDEWEPAIGANEVKVNLRYPPSYVLVKLNQMKAKRLGGLAEGVIPITPIQKSMTIIVDKK